MLEKTKIIHVPFEPLSDPNLRSAEGAGLQSREEQHTLTVDEYSPAVESLGDDQRHVVPTAVGQLSMRGDIHRTRMIADLAVVQFYFHGRRIAEGGTEERNGLARCVIAAEPEKQTVVLRFASTEECRLQTNRCTIRTQ